MMLQQGHGFSVSHTLDEEVVRVQKIADATEEQGRTILEAVAIQVLSWVYADFRVKARGGTDPAGIKWEPITEAAIRSRLGKLQSYRNASKATKNQLVAAAMANHEIGIDTGRLLGSLEYGRTVDNVFELSEESVTIGSAVAYAGHFAAKRPILDPKMITDERERELEEIAEEILGKKIGQIVAA